MTLPEFSIPSHCRGKRVIRVTHGVQEITHGEEDRMLCYVRAELEDGSTAVGRWDGKEFRWITWT